MKTTLIIQTEDSLLTKQMLSKCMFVYWAHFYTHVRESSTNVTFVSGSVPCWKATVKSSLTVFIPWSSFLTVPQTLFTNWFTVNLLKGPQFRTSFGGMLHLILFCSGGNKLVTRKEISRKADPTALETTR